MTLSRRDALKLLGAGAAASLLPRNAKAQARRLPEGTRSTDVVVVGAGFAGLAAARVLLRAGKRVVILDARDRVGGRVKAGRIAGQTIDLGGQWVGPKQTRLLALLKEYGIATMPQYVKGRALVELAGHRFAGPGEEVSLGKEGDAALAKALARIRWLVAEVPLETPWSAPNAAAWDRLTMADWIDGQTRDPRARAMLRLMVEGLYTAEPAQVSLLFFLSYIKSGGSLEELWGTENAAQAYHVPGSMHQLAGRMGAELLDHLALGAPATAVIQDGEGVTVDTASGAWRGARAIVTVPLPLTVRLRWEPALPPARDALAQRSPMGSVIKYWVAYPEPFWRKRGWNGDVTSDRSPTSGFYDASPPDASVGLLVGFIEADDALALTGRPTEERRRLVVARVADLLGPEGASPLDYVDNDWVAEPWTRGCYGVFMGPGTLTTLGPALRAPFERVHWAGTECSPIWSGYIEGALRSGESAAAEAVAALG
ncbi:MAG TPA: FAD-dependent oxidoreductase [Thermoanaerobaculia bacterium]|nr:FAD-dependent oxidoreductase [Thermoanaerobaculia bacterium]